MRSVLSSADGVRTSMSRPYVRLARPRQWTKNLLVAAAPFAAGSLTEATAIVGTAVGIVAFTLVAVAMYALNDAADAEADRLHPRKANRPVAAGAISPGSARIFGGIALAVGLAVAIATGSWGFVGVVAAYGAMTIAYSQWLKQVALLDIGIIALGFVLRAVAGAVLVDVPISVWFFVVAAFGALLIAAGKRFGERAELGGNGSGHRLALDDYAPGFLEFLLGVSTAVVLLGYSLWAFEIHGDAGGIPWALVSVAPFVGIVLRYAQLVYLGRGGEPETLVLSDRGLQVLGVVWALAIGVTFYGGAT